MSPERFQRINQLLDLRQPDLTMCLEGVHKSHNLAAMVRTADAVGVHELHAIWFDKKNRITGGTAMGSQNWVRVHHHPAESSSEVLETLQREGKQVLVTNLSTKSVDFRQIDYTKPTCIVMGQEKHGVTDEAIKIADHEIIIPMVGMVESLNVSVAAAVVLYEAQRQRQAAGMYGLGTLNAEERHRVLFEGGHPIFAKLCKQKGMAYPPLDDAGQIMADDAWWQAIRTARQRTN